MNATIAKLNRQVMDDVRRHCEEEYPNEACGVILQLADGCTHARRIRNVQDEMHALDPVRYPRTARTAYTGHADDLRLAIEAGEEPGCALVAFYHSHPDEDSYFSAEDTAQATPFGEPSYEDALQLVASVRERVTKITKAFAWSPGEAAYVEIPVEEIEP